MALFSLTSSALLLAVVNVTKKDDPGLGETAPIPEGHKLGTDWLVFPMSSSEMLKQRL